MAQKNMLQYVILGLLHYHRLAGYDIKKLFDCEIGDFWHAKHSQIYPELKRLEEAKLITSQTKIVGQKLEKKYYTITQTGKNLLIKWLDEPLEEIQPTRDDFTLKLYFMNDKSNPRIVTIFTEEMNLHKEKYFYLTVRMNELFDTQEKQEANFGHYLILKHAVQREKMHLEWLEKELTEIIRK